MNHGKDTRPSILGLLVTRPPERPPRQRRGRPHGPTAGRRGPFRLPGAGVIQSQRGAALRKKGRCSDRLWARAALIGGWARASVCVCVSACKSVWQAGGSRCWIPKGGVDDGLPHVVTGAHGALWPLLPIITIALLLFLCESTLFASLTAAAGGGAAAVVAVGHRQSHVDDTTACAVGY